MFRIENNFAEPFLVNNAEKTDYFPIKTISFHGSCILLLKIHNRILPNKLVDQSAVTLITSFHTWICSPREAGTRSSESSPVAVHFMLCAQSNSLTTSNVSLTTRIIYLQHLGQCYDPLCAMDKYTNVWTDSRICVSKSLFISWTRLIVVCICPAETAQLSSWIKWHVKAPLCFPRKRTVVTFNVYVHYPQMVYVLQWYIPPKT